MIEIIGFVLKLIGYVFSFVEGNAQKQERFQNDIKDSFKKSSDAVRIYKTRIQQRYKGTLKVREILEKRKNKSKTVFEKSKDEENPKG